MIITVSIQKAKDWAHEQRRSMRDKEFAPLDAIIAKQIPGTDAQLVEAQRQAVRDKYAVMQTEIDASETLEQIKTALGI